MLESQLLSSSDLNGGTRARESWSISSLQTSTFALVVPEEIMLDILLWLRQDQIISERSSTSIFYPVVYFVAPNTTFFSHVSLGLIQPTCTGLIGPGVVVHVPSFFAELEQLEAKGEFSFLVLEAHQLYAKAHTGLSCEGRIFVSDRAQLVFDFHQIVDGLKEVELGGSRYVHLF
jgi:hypothetical protein